MEKTLNDNEELRKKIIDSYDSSLKDIFTEDEILAILDALKSQSPSPNTYGGIIWPTTTLNTGYPNSNPAITLNNNDMFKFHPESEPIYNNTVISSVNYQGEN